MKLQRAPAKVNTMPWSEMDDKQKLRAWARIFRDEGVPLYNFYKKNPLPYISHAISTIK